MSKKLLPVILLLIPFLAKSQDMITLRNGEQVDCKITKVDSTNIFYDFKKGDRLLSSFIEKKNVRSYKTGSAENQEKGPAGIVAQTINTTVLLDTSKYIKETNKWSNLLTYSRKYGTHASGWSLQYYGFNLKNTSKWIIPVVFGLEGFNIDSEYFSQSDYYSVNMSYLLAGISPFYKLDKNIYLSLGAQIIYGQEELQDLYGKETISSFWGLAPSQGIYFISESDFGLIVGLSAYEKILSSKVYKNDIGIKLELGIKF